ncbi:hypothetical protein BH11BAC3_BH11BAC3_00790 [soil metagenome]
MKKYFIILTLLSGSALVAQEVNKPVQISHYVFESFTKGKVLLKSGAVSDQLLNYNSITGEMIFDNGGKLLAIGDPAAVDTVYIEGRKFIPVSDKFYEILTTSSTPLMLEFSCTVEDPSVSIGYGNSTPGTNYGTVKNLNGNSRAYELKLPSDFKITPAYTYWIYKAGKFQKANNAQQLSKIFSGKKDFIKEFVKENNTSFSKREDVIKLVQAVEE